MDIMGFIMGIVWLPIAIGVVLLLAVAYFVVKTHRKTAKAGEVLVISGGGKGLRIYKSGGAFVNPFNKFNFFSLAVRTVRSGNQEAQTKTHVPVLVEWTAQIRPDTTTDAQLTKAIEGFISYDSQEMTSALQQTLDGEIRAVVATMTPEEVVQDKETFSKNVTDNAKKRMEELGFELVSLNIAEVSDRNGYFGDLAAEDREAKRQKAATLKAEAEKNISVQQAEATRLSRAAELDRDLALGEKNREVTLRKAAIKAETDAAEADANVAGELRRTERAKEVATNEGAVAVVKAEQDQKAADAQRAAELIRAETEKQRREIDAAAEARKDEIEADAQAAVSAKLAKGEADAAAAKAQGEAEATRAKAQGEADAINRTTEAKADQVRRTGLAEAEVAEAKGKAEASAIRERGKAEAEAQRLMADALAANEGANLKVSIAQIESETRIKVATAYGEAIYGVGTNATFIDMGGSNNGGGNLLSQVLGSIPELAKQLDVKNEALNGVPFGETLSGLIRSVKGDFTQATDEAEPAPAQPSASVVDSIASAVGLTPETLAAVAGAAIGSAAADKVPAAVPLAAALLSEAPSEE